MDEPTRNRIGLWLRGERAFGLSLVGPLPSAGAGGASIAEASPVLDAVVEPPAPRHAAPASNPPAAASVSRAAPPGTALFESATPGADAEPSVQASRPAPLTLEEKRHRLKLMNEQEVSVCTKCRLCETRSRTVFGEGDPDAKIFFIGEGPGETEDQTGRPFVGRAGELLTKQIAAMGLRRDQVFIANIVKCRPPGNRVPAPDEVATCTPYLERQLEIVRPQVIVTLGLPASKYMLESSSTMGRLRGQWHSRKGIKLMPTYHPSFLLRSPTYENRSAVWSDLQKVMAEVGLPLKKSAGQG